MHFKCEKHTAATSEWNEELTKLPSVVASPISWKRSYTKILALVEKTAGISASLSHSCLLLSSEKHNKFSPCLSLSTRRFLFEKISQWITSSALLDVDENSRNVTQQQLATLWFN